MPSKAKIFITGIILGIYVLTSAGCAVAWFLAGAGTAATVVAVTAEDKKDQGE